MSGQCYQAVIDKYGNSEITMAAYNMSLGESEKESGSSFYLGNVIIFSIGVTIICFMEATYMVLYLIDKLQAIGNEARFPILRQRNPLFSLVSLLGYIFIFLIGPGNLSFHFNCTTYLWLQTLSFPFILFPLTARILLNYIRIAGSQKMAEMFRSTMKAKGFGDMMFHKHPDRSQNNSNLSTSMNEITSKLVHAPAAQGQIPEISIISESDGDIPFVAPKTNGENETYGNKKLSNSSDNDSNHNHRSRSRSHSNASDASNQHLAIKDDGKNVRDLSVNLSINGNHDAASNRGSLLGSLPIQRRFHPDNTSTGLLLSWSLTIPYIVAAATLTATGNVYQMGCSGCYITSKDIIGWIIAGVIFIIVALFVLYQLRDFPDPFQMKREIVGLLFSFIIFSAIGIPLVIINPLSYNWLVLCIMCVALHSQSIWRATYYGLLDHLNKDSTQPNTKGSNDQNQQPYILGAKQTEKRQKSRLTSTLRTSNHQNNEQKYTVEELITTMSHTPLGQLFEKHLIAEHNDENIDFMRNVLLFEQRYDEDEKEYRQKKARRIYETYIKLGCVSQINISHNQRTSLDEKFFEASKPSVTTAAGVKTERHYVKKNVFREAKLEIILLIENDSLPRFINSSEYKAFVKKMRKEHHTIVTIQNSTAISSLA